NPLYCWPAEDAKGGYCVIARYRVEPATTGVLEHPISAPEWELFPYVNETAMTVALAVPELASRMKLLAGGVVWQVTARPVPAGAWTIEVYLTSTCAVRVDVN